MSGGVIAVRPMDDQRESPGRRLRVQQDEPDDLVLIVDETTLPECVHRIDAHRLTQHAEFLFTATEFAWLHRVGSALRSGAGEPLSGWVDLVTYSETQLVAHLRYLRQAMVTAAAELGPIAERTYELRIADADRELAIRNVRETRRQEASRALDSGSADQVPE